MPQQKELKNYFKCLERNSTQISCVRCGSNVLPKDYERHCLQNHNLNSKLKCVWCNGEKSWTRGDKGNHADHLLECWRNFMTTHVYEVVVTEAPEDTHPFDTTLTCSEKNFFHYFRISDLPTLAYELFSLLSLAPLLLTFTLDNLNLAASCVLTYLNTRGDTEWFHVMVRAVAMESFINEINSSRARTLPFSCWCDGGIYREARYRQHRHMIVVSPKMPEERDNFRQKVWLKVDAEDRPRSHFPCKRLKVIASPMHLVNTIGYLSQRKSRCNFSFDRETTQERKKHFYIFTALPADYRLALVTLWDGGLLQLVNQNFQHVDPHKLVRRPMTFSEGRWKMRIKDIPGIRLNLTLPFSNQVFPTLRTTDLYLHLVDGKKIYFEREPNNSPPYLFYHCVGEEWWTPGHQKYLKDVKPLFDRNMYLETQVSEMNSLKRKLESAEHLLRELEEENSNLRKRIRILEEGGQ